MFLHVTNINQLSDMLNNQVAGYIVECAIVEVFEAEFE